MLATGLGIWMLGLIGRRPLLMTGQIGAIVAHLLIGICSLTLPANLRFVPFCKKSFKKGDKNKNNKMSNSLEGVR